MQENKCNYFIIFFYTIHEQDQSKNLLLNAFLAINKWMHGQSIFKGKNKKCFKFVFVVCVLVWEILPVPVYLSWWQLSVGLKVSGKPQLHFWTYQWKSAKAGPIKEISLVNLWRQGLPPSQPSPGLSRNHLWTTWALTNLNIFCRLFRKCTTPG